ncbi:MAG: hypothetical protein HYX41_01900 [Bdellovibrio sp.]|nr:hypothetical protein [Bdellovibrio sp.]
MKNRVGYTTGLLVLILSTTNANAGVGSSGGGNAVVCRGPDGKIVSAELLDLYEAKNVFGSEIKISNSSELDQALNAAQEIGKGEGLNSQVDAYLSHEVRRIQSTLRVLPPGTGIVPIDDSHNVIIPKNCTLEQLAIYQMNDQLLVDGDIWGQLNKTNRAALLVHEAMYLFLRGSGETTSVRARMIVGRAFSGERFVPIREGIPVESTICREEQPTPGRSLQWEFFAYRNQEGRITLQFLTLDGRDMISKSTGTLPLDLWPLPTSTNPRVEWISLESLIDGGTPIMLYFRPTANSQTELYIAVAQNFSSANKVKLICK